MARLKLSLFEKVAMRLSMREMTKSRKMVMKISYMSSSLLS